MSKLLFSSIGRDFYARHCDKTGFHTLSYLCERITDLHMQEFIFSPEFNGFVRRMIASTFITRATLC